MMVQNEIGPGGAPTPFTPGLTDWKESAVSDAICSIEGCGRTSRTRGWCKGHYRRWQVHGGVRASEPLGAPRNVSQEERFWWLVDKVPGGCWPFKGSRRGDALAYGGFAGTTAHRYSWSLANGRKPRRDEVIRHKCDNPLCVNPAHLEAGSQRQNVDDMYDRERGRHIRGLCLKGHPLTPENTIVRKDGNRRCRKCTNEYNRAWRAERRRQNAAPPNPYGETPDEQ